MLAICPAHLRADMQQFYGLNLDHMGDQYSVSHAADCAALLPYEARVWHQIDQFQNNLAETEGKKQKEEDEDKPFALEIDEYKKALNQKWKDE